MLRQFRRYRTSSRPYPGGVRLPSYCDIRIVYATQLTYKRSR
jgi:hypothetical protein